MTLLRKIRITRGKTQQEVANYCNISQSCYSRYELGIRKVKDYSVAERISEFLGTSVSKILPYMADYEKHLTEDDT